MSKIVNVRYPLPIKIAGLGRYLPKRVVTSSELEEKCKLPAGWCERKQGVRERRWIEDQTMTYMAAEATKEAMANAGVEPGDIDLIICASPHIDRAIPGGSIMQQQELGAPFDGIPCFNISAACLGFMASLDFCACMLNRERYKNILVTTSEINSFALDFNNPNVCTLFGDGAAAAVLTKPSAGDACSIHAARMETYSVASDVSSMTREQIPNTLFNKDIPPGSMSFDYDPQGLQSTAMKYNQKFLAKLWPMSNKDIIKLVIPNQASRFVLDMMKFIFPPHKIMGIIDHTGNIGAVGYPMALYEAVNEKKIQRGDMVLMTGIGAGFSIYGIVLSY